MNHCEYIIRPETKGDAATTENITREAFWNVYQPGCDEHYILHRYRGLPEYIPELSLVLEENGEILAHIMYSHAQVVTTEGKSVPVVLFGPVSVRPDKQKMGYGSALIRESLVRAKTMGFGAVVITGSAEYYSRFGFGSAQSFGVYYGEISDEPTPFFMALELKPGYLDGVRGVYSDPPGYLVDDADALAAFDAQFPKKEKLKLPGQIFGD